MTFDEVLTGDDPLASFGDEVVKQLAGMEPEDLARAFANLRERWPKAGCWRELKTAVKTRRREAKSERASSGEDGRPDIQADGERHIVVAEAETALAVREAEVYVRGGGVGLVRILPADPAAPGPIRREGGTPMISTAPAAWRGAVLSCAARWHVMREVDGVVEKRYLPAPPREVVDALASMGGWPRLRFLAGVSEGPVLRPDGSIASTPGYDPASGYLLIYDREAWPASAGVLDQTEARTALDEMLAPTAQFPYVDETDRAAFAALVLTILGRVAIDGPVPMWGMTSPTAGTGKSLLARLAGMVGSGRVSATATLPRRAEEVRKVLLSVALSGASVVLFDNVTGEVESGELCAAITAGEVSDRVLGESRQVTAPWRTVVTMTGNHLTPRGDLVRRSILVRLDAECEAPDERDGWEIPDLLAYVRENRPRLATAGLAVLLAHAAAGRPRPASLGSPLGSFETWDRVVRAAVSWASGVDPLERRIDARTADPEWEAIATLFGAWERALGATSATTQDVAAAADSSAMKDYDEDGKTRAADLRAALETLVDRGMVTSRSIGYVLRRLVDRPTDGKVLRRDGRSSKTKGVRWRLASLDGSPIPDAEASSGTGVGDTPEVGAPPSWMFDMTEDDT